MLASWFRGSRPVLGLLALATLGRVSAWGNVCEISPLGDGQDDTDQVLAAIAECGHYGTTVLGPGDYNITKKMTWDLVSSKVELHGYLNFVPDIQYWLQNSSTYRVVFIQSQASWFVVTGSDFEIDAFNSGGIRGNGQLWWSYYATPPQVRDDGDGRPLALTLYRATRGKVKNFRIESPPFWCNCVAESNEVVYDGMYCNSTNEDPTFFGQNIVWNTDGIDTYRSDSVQLLNWDITTGDDCLAIKGNTTNLFIKNVTCHGGNGIAFGSLGQYVELVDIVENVTITDVVTQRLDPEIMPNMIYGVYFKSWDGSINGAPPTGGGAGPGYTKNVTVSNVLLDHVNFSVAITQTNVAEPGDLPSTYQFEDLTFTNFTGTTISNPVVDLECSSAAPCANIAFADIDATPPAGPPTFACVNVVNAEGLSGPCTATAN